MQKDSNEEFYWLIGICIGILLFCSTDSSIHFTDSWLSDSSLIQAAEDCGRIFVSGAIVLMTMCKSSNQQLT